MSFICNASVLRRSRVGSISLPKVQSDPTQIQSLYLYSYPYEPVRNCICGQLMLSICPCGKVMLPNWQNSSSSDMCGQRMVRKRPLNRSSHSR